MSLERMRVDELQRRSWETGVGGVGDFRSGEVGGWPDGWIESDIVMNKSERKAD